METTLADVWFGVIGFILIIYLVTDGFDLGVGILSLLSPDEAHRSALMSTVGSVWHANQTWLVVLGGLLFGAFPLAYGVAVSALYIPVSVMLFGLIFRGVALEFRENSENKRLWSLAFGGGSLIASLAQGFVAGAILGGLRIENGRFAGGVWDWLNPFAALAAATLLFAYTLIGAAYTIVKSRDEVQAFGYRWGLVGAVLTLLGALGLCYRIAAAYPYVTRKWSAWPDSLITLFPLVIGIAAYLLVVGALVHRKEYPAFWGSVGLFVFSLLGLAAGLHPYLLPPSVTLADAAAQPLVLKIMLIGTGILLPLMLIYNGYQYVVFKGKIAGEK